MASPAQKEAKTEMMSTISANHAEVKKRNKNETKVDAPDDSRKDGREHKAHEQERVGESHYVVEDRQVV